MQPCDVGDVGVPAVESPNEYQTLSLVGDVNGLRVGCRLSEHNYIQYTLENSSF